MLITEKMSLNHSEILEWFVSNFELDCGPHILEFQKLGSELVSDKSSGVRVNVIAVNVLIPILGRRLGYLEQGLLGVQVPDLEPGEVDAVDVVLRATEIVLCD